MTHIHRDTSKAAEYWRDLHVEQDGYSYDIHADSDWPIAMVREVPMAHELALLFSAAPKMYLALKEAGNALGYGDVRGASMAITAAIREAETDSFLDEGEA